MIVQPKEKSASETLRDFNNAVADIKESIVSLRSQSQAIETEFNSLDALRVLASIESKVDAFITRYDAVLGKAESNLELEREALENLNKASGKL